ncbi:MAG: hypothetical protein B0A82_23585 [Alkalinema sp. CACIAM 70d]|nr:MAG: hypothetical protein B0A82_23585 [Alkalinema sp. CACIAM 70d]
MSDWQRDLAAAIEGITEQVTELVLEVSQEVAETVDGLLDLSEDAVSQLQSQVKGQVEAVLDTELEPFLNGILNPLFGLSIADLLEPPGSDEATVGEGLIQFDLSEDLHPVCRGCKHFHGQVYGGNLLVCGMHPYGVPEGVDQCPDREVVDLSQPGTRDWWD